MPIYFDEDYNYQLNLEAEIKKQNLKDISIRSSSGLSNYSENKPQIMAAYTIDRAVTTFKSLQRFQGS